MAKKKSEHEVHVQSTMAANELGMNVKTFRHYMDINKIKETELYYDKKFGGFVGYNTRNQKRYVYTVEKAGRYTSYFTDKQGLYMMQNNPHLYPQLLASATGVYIHGFDGDRQIIDDDLMEGE